MSDYVVTVSIWNRHGPTGEVRKVRVKALSKDDAVKKGRIAALQEMVDPKTGSLPDTDPVVTEVHYINSRKD